MRAEIILVFHVISTAESEVFKRVTHSSCQVLTFADSDRKVYTDEQRLLL